MPSKLRIPFEQRAKEEAQEIKISWNSGPYNFLLMRTAEKYRHKSAFQRRAQAEIRLNLLFPQMTDEMLLALYKEACLKYMKLCQNEYRDHSGFSKTSSERDFSKTLSAIIKDNPQLKHLEIYPSEDHSRDIHPGLKMVVGNYVPDFLIFGIKIKGCSSVVIEIDGDSHLNKTSKDDIRNDHLKEIKAFTFEIPNNQVRDAKFITKSLLAMCQARNGSFNQQILRAKRLIWIKTISCQLSIFDIEELIHAQFAIRLNLREEAQSLIQAKDCPRIIREELRSKMIGLK